MYLTTFNQCTVHRTVSRKKRSKENRTSVIVQEWRMFNCCYKDTTLVVTETPHKRNQFSTAFDFNWNKADPVCQYGDFPLFEWLKTGGSSRRCQQWASSRRNRDIMDLLFTNIQHLDKHWSTNSVHCMQTLFLYNQSFLLITMKLQKKSHYIISLKIYVVKNMQQL